MENKADVIFVSGVLISGFNNGVTNVSFTTMQYLPGQDVKGDAIVVPTQYISADLRMDLFCVQELHARLGKIIEDQTSPAKKDMN